MPARARGVPELARWRVGLVGQCGARAIWEARGKGNVRLVGSVRMCGRRRAGPSRAGPSRTEIII
jgi:hypothetical protein